MCGTNNDLHIIVSSNCAGLINFNLINIPLIFESFQVTMATWAFYDKCLSTRIPE